MAHDVFVSYSHHDKPVADAVCANLEANRIRCWIAPRDVIPGQDWGAAIVEAIQSARVMVLVFSSHANTSVQIRREVQLAVDAETVLIPFRIEDVAPTQSLKYYLGTPHWLDALTLPLEAHVERLAAAVTSFLAVSGPVGSSAGSVTTPQSGLGTDTAPPSTRGGEHRIEQGIPAPESVAAEDARKSGPTRDRRGDAVLPTDMSTPGKARLFERLSRRTKIALAAGIVVSVVAIVVGIVVGSNSPSDPEAAASKQLQALKDGDSPAIAQVAGQWIPQLSSKHATQPWTTDSEDNVVYKPVQILQDHQRLRQLYGARLVWSGDWTTFAQPDYWVSVVPNTYPDSASVLKWCRTLGQDSDHCIAQILSRALGPAGTHAY